MKSPSADLTIQGASVSVSNLTMRYGSMVALDNVTLDVAEGEFLALLGPSGSGKSTILMNIAGFNIPSAGEIRIGSEVVTNKPPHKRGIGMVFQRYALFPHLTVAENIAYPLRRRGWKQKLIADEVERVLELVDLGAYGARYPAQLSGGQQQRIAVARAIVFKPSVLLMDEPLGALDRKLRQQLQLEIKRLHRTIGCTIIFVTHDQEEALSMADRVAVMRGGRIEQIGDPTSLYERPATDFVADFIGETNFIDVAAKEIANGSAIVAFPGFEQDQSVPTAKSTIAGGKSRLGVRPEHFLVSTTRQGLKANLLEKAYAGETTTLLVGTELGELKVRLPSNELCSGIEHGSEIHLIPDMKKSRYFVA
ncbi:ATP-binding cassette domain-containing protein [Bosea vaviloviae]|uniref:ATP-binding cassette domain-containing protein n=1 Tax=Bosea vaviloviae TaxID=1526658 RepID=UPI0011E063C1